MNSFAKDLFAVTKSRGTVIACGILTSIITARYLGPKGNGIVATLTVYPTIFMTIGSLGIRQSTAYFVGQKKYREDDIFSSVLCIWIFTTVFCIVTCLLLLTTFSKESYQPLYVFMALLPIPFSLFTTYSSGLFLGRNEIKDFNTVNWVPNVVKLVSYVLFLVILPWDIFGALIGIVTSFFFLCFFVWNKVRKIVPIRFRFNKTIVKSMLSLGLIYALSLLIINLNYKLDVVLLEQYSTHAEIGIYTKGVSIVEYIWEVPTLLSTIIFARSANAADGKLFSYKVCQLLRLCFIIILGMSVVFYFLSDWMMVLLYGEPFRASADAQKLLLPGILFLTVFKVLNMDLAGKGKPWIAITAMVPSLLVNILLNCLWDKQYGANGAAMASTVSYTVSAVIFLIMYSRNVGIPIKRILAFSTTDFDFIKTLLEKFKGRKAVKNSSI